jgi:arginyl-tRNA synthetase
MKEEVVVNLFKKAGINISDNHISPTPDPKLGDISCTIAFEIAKKKNKNPNDVAAEIALKLKPSGIISQIKVVGPYINLFLDRNKFSRKVIGDSMKKGFGSGKKRKDKVMVEFSQPNTHKPFHVGHIRGTSLGESLSRILKFQGFPVTKSNYSGDTGMHIAKCLWCYLRFHKGKEPEKNRGLWLGEIYAEANKRLEEKEDYMEEVKKLNKKLEEGDDLELMKLWKTTRKWCIDEFNHIYKEMDASFDRWFFEREVETRGKELALRLLKHGIAKRSEGAVIIDLKKYDLGVFVLLREDGTVLYSAKDLALAEMKFKEFKIDRSIYIVGSEQKFYFRQLFKTLELMGFKQVEKCYHLVFDLVLLPTGKMSSRKGTALTYANFRDKMFDRR